ncbi:hypothetical protein CBR_g28017 [Chara braunii]|uniref:Zinc-finger domain-containing protein n=1 Tax=Chara braunii TaxID=69332 RepID=A0A388L931_CHABU|nr:hypothetical protein CBR_g28017 [Chara braunii]|eukprot:GBG78794.1 hypothetical protein CBR_g28017 [Chara braunii]
MARTRRATRSVKRRETVALKVCKPDPDEAAMAGRSLKNTTRGGVKNAAANGVAKTAKRGGGTNSYEEQRLARIAENKARLLAAGIHSDVANLRASMITAASTRSVLPPSRLDLKKVKLEEGVDDVYDPVGARGGATTRWRVAARVEGPRRRSQRLVGMTPVNYNIGDRKEDRKPRLNRPIVKKEYEVGAFERLPANALTSSAARRRKVYDNMEVDVDVKPLVLPPHLQQHRCDSKGRGSVYDPVVGLCCHFCRQKKLCGEPDCERCGRMDVTKRCTGKTECNRCRSSTGIFCRACILIRYGLSVEEVRANPKWICAHCTEAEGSDPYWICNSSVCLKRHKLAPLGVAIYEARRHGYPSVAHLLKAKLQGLVQ